MGSAVSEKMERVLRSCLNELSTLDGAARVSLFPMIAKTLFYIPAALLVDTGAHRGTSRAHFAALTEKQKNVIPAFTVEDDLLSWGGERYNSLPIYGCDFAGALPKNTSIVINPGDKQAVYLSANELKLLSDEHIVTDEALKRVNELLQGVANDRGPSNSRLVNLLSLVLEKYPEIVEGYLLQTDGEGAEVILGLLCEDLPVERRFFFSDRHCRTRQESIW